MNKAIQYREDGKFYGLVNVLEEPQRKDFELSGSYMLACNRYDSNLRSCIAAGKEIINPEVLPIRHRNDPRPFNYWVHIDSIALIKPGEIFPCPDNIEFEEDQFCAYHNLNCSYCGTCDGSCYKPEKVIRLKLKEEVKTEESQDKLWNEVAITFMNKYSKPAIEENKSKFTITRK